MRADRIGAINLNDDNRSDSSLLRTDDRVQVTKDYIPPHNSHHWISPRAKRSS